MDFLSAATVLSPATMGHSAAHGGVVMERPPFYENQIRSVKKIVTFFRDGKEYVILHAQMQSGKSDTFMLAGAELVRLGLFDRFVVVSGNSETLLRKQTENVHDFRRRYRKYLRDVVGLSVDAAEDAENRVMSGFSVYWGHSQLKKAPQFNNTLIMCDESHYAQSIKDSPENFFRRQGIQSDGGSSARGNKTLSISATPFSERIDNEKYKQNKGYVKMRPGEGYVGIDDFIKNGCFKPYNDRDEIKTFNSLLPKLKTSKRNKAIVRVSGKNIEKYAGFCVRHDINAIIYDKDSTADITELLNSPDPLVILVNGRMRMGYVLKNKEYINFIFLRPTTTTNSDTLYQGLVGRLCGYFESTKATPNVEIHLPKRIWNEKHFQTFADYWNDKKDSDGFINGKNVPKSPKKHKGFVPAIPEVIRLDLSDNWLEETIKDLKQYAKDTICHPNFLENTKNDMDVVRNFQNRVEQGTCILGFNNFNTKSHEGHESTMRNAYDLNEELSESVGPSKNTSQDGSQAKLWFAVPRPLKHNNLLAYAKWCKKYNRPLILYIQFRRQGVVSRKTTGKERFGKDTKCEQAHALRKLENNR